MSVFKACDIRGAYPTELHEPLYADLGRAVGTLLHERSESPSALVAGDLRLSTPALQAALIEGLVAAGCRVTNLGFVPTPVAYFALRRLRTDGLAIVTASHNPPGDNGLKLCLGPMPITLEEMARVEQTLASRRFAAGRGTLEALAIGDGYVAWVCDGAEPGSGLKLVLDCGNGSYSELAPRVLRRLGYDVVELFCTPDGTFPNRPPDPAVSANLAALRQAVRRSGAAFGVALDGDGDRVGIVDDAGRSLTGDQAIILLARHILSNPFPLPLSSPLPVGEGRVRDAGPACCSDEGPHPSPLPEGEGAAAEGEGGGAEREKVVCDIKCSKAVLEAVAACGATPLLERSGHTFIKARMIAEGALFGGELSGHFFYRELGGGDDGLYSILRIAELAKAAPQPLSVVVDAMPRYATTPDVRIRYTAQDAPERLEQIAAAARGEVLRLDGVRVAYPDGWGLVRCSVTEPLLTFRFEAYAGSPREIADRFLAPVPDLRGLVLQRLDALKGNP
jgi:phosphomannomutase/phosphoglucomutase